MGKSGKQQEIPDPPAPDPYLGGSIYQDGRLLAETKKGTGNEYTTSVYSDPYQKTLQGFGQNALYTPAQNTYKTVYDTPYLDESAARAAYNKQYASNPVTNNTNKATGSFWAPVTNGTLQTAQNTGSSKPGQNSSPSYDDWLSQNRDKYMVTPSHQEVTGSTPASGILVDYQNMLGDAKSDYATNRDDFNRLYSNDKIYSQIQNANVLSDAFNTELDKTMQIRLNNMLDPYNQTYNDVAKSTALDYARRFGSLNNSGFQTSMGRNEENYAKGLANIMDNNELARSTEKQNQLAMQQQGLNNVLNERNALYGRMNDYQSDITQGIGIYNSLANGQTIDPTSIGALNQLQSIGSQNYQQELAYNQALVNNAVTENQLSRSNGMNPWLAGGLAGAGLLTSALTGGTTSPLAMAGLIV